MSSPDELQQLWVKQATEKENTAMWADVVEEKRAGFAELVRAENSSEYLVAAILVPLLALVAWRAHDPRIQTGYALMAAALLGLAVCTWLIYRNPGPPVNNTVRDHLCALVRQYDDRIAFLRKATLAIGIPLSIGVLLIFVNRGSVAGWVSALLLLALFWGGSALRLHRREKDLLKKRLQVEAIMRRLED